MSISIPSDPKTMVLEYPKGSYLHLHCCSGCSSLNLGFTHPLKERERLRISTSFCEEEEGTKGSYLHLHCCSGCSSLNLGVTHHCGPV